MEIKATSRIKCKFNNLEGIAKIGQSKIGYWYGFIAKRKVISFEITPTFIAKQKAYEWLEKLEETAKPSVYNPALSNWWTDLKPCFQKKSLTRQKLRLF